MKQFYAYLRVFCLLLCTMPVWAQQLQIQGQVRGANGEALSGITVQVKGSEVSVATTAQGRFSITAPGQGTLIFRSIGFRTLEEPISNRKLIDVSLQHTEANLDEVVVVGYGTQKKVNLTGSVSTVDQKAFESRAISNVMSALQGAAPGLVITRSGGQPGSEGFSTNIRGELSTGSANPLILIDGVPGSLTYTNPDDIASVSILKDASATAIYGSRGAAGVILVTTKRGQGKTKISYQSMLSTKKMGLFPERINSWEEAEMQNMARLNAGQSPDWTEEHIALMKDPNFYYRVNPTNSSVYEYLGNFNYPDLLLKDRSSRQNHNLSISGSNDKESFLMSLAYVKDVGMFKVGPDDYNRLNAMMNYDRELFKNLSLETKILYSKSKLNNNVYGSSNDYGLIYNLVSQRSTMPIFLPESDDQLYAAGSPAAMTYALLKDGGVNKTANEEISASVALHAKNVLTEGLSFRALYSPRLVMTDVNNTQIPVPMYNLTGRTAWAGGINMNSITRSRGKDLSNNFQFVSEFNRTFSDRHEVLARAGYRYDDFRYDYMFASASNLPTDDILALSQYLDKENTSVSDNIQSNALISFFGTAQYVFDSRYIIQATLNREGSSRLSPENRWITLPGVSAGWRVNQESWFKEATSFFQELKIRAAWGKQANDPNSNNLRANNYEYLATMSRGNAYPFNNTRNTYYYVNSPATPLRTWEDITNTDVGLDFSMLNSRLSGNFSYFWRKTDGTYATIVQPAVFGMGNPSTNLGVLKSWGWELSLSWADNIGADFSYYIRGNIADNNNRVESYLNRNTVGLGVVGILEGYAKNSIFGYIADGYFQNEDEIRNHANQQFTNTAPGDIRYVDRNNDGIISVGDGNLSNMGDLAYLGTTNPRYQYGLNIGFQYKGFDFGAFIQGVGKRSFLLPNIMTLPFVESWRQPWAIHKDSWTPDNPDAMFPRLLMGGGSNTRTSSKWVVNGAYTRLKNIQVGYTIPEKITSRVGISKFRVYFTGEDLWESTKSWHPYYDPETPNGQAFGYPFFRTMTLGVNLTF